MTNIELSQLPGLDGAQALYGSLTQATASADSIVEILIFVHDNVPPVASLSA